VRLGAPPVALEARRAGLDARPVALNAPPPASEARPAGLDARPVALSAPQPASDARPVALDAPPPASDARPGLDAPPAGLDAGPGLDRSTALVDELDAAADLILGGAIVAIKGLGGYQLACDATRADAVARLRQRKRRDAKPFALMARDLDVVRRHARVSPAEEAALCAPEAPIVLLAAAGQPLPDAVAPGLRTLGFMLPTTPLHLLLLRRIDRPVVMTSGNLSDEPQVIRDEEVRARLGAIADHALVHDRAIAIRLDDSVARVMAGGLRLVRRARGYAPAPIALPPGFERAPALLAFGGELKSTFCLLRAGAAIVSHHMGDLEDAATFDDYRAGLALYAALFDHQPAALACDRHPEYRSSRLARARAAADRLPLFETLHHHAHVAACLADGGRPLHAPPVLGIALDGLGWGDDDTLWGGEFLLADYASCRRLATFKPVAMPGGDRAAREPWRNLYAHLVAAFGWDAFAAEFAQLELHQRLAAAPRALLDGMLRAGLNAPLASSCGRLFDAFAAAIGVAFDQQAYEGEAPARLEALATLADDTAAYPLAISRLPGGMACIDPAPLWRAALDDLAGHTSAPAMASRFHRGLARAIATMAHHLAATARFDTVALTGGCFQNRILFEDVAALLAADGFRVLAHSRVPAGDGGLALGQAAIAAARSIAHLEDRGDAACASAFPAAS
jgi:hydrogenase maturation protein HypF